MQIQKSSTLTRTITGVILVLVFGACVALGRYTSVAFFAVFGCIACVELANALHVMKIRSSPWPACILLVLICAALLLKLPSAWSIIALAVMVLAVLMYALFFKVEYENVLAEMKQRDYNDSHRAVAPLKPAEDSVIVDTTGISLEESVEKILSVIKEKL